VTLPGYSIKPLRGAVLPVELNLTSADPGMRGLAKKVRGKNETTPLPGVLS
jgi:hypothetical protein